MSSANNQERRNMTKDKQYKYGPEADELLESWKPTQKPKQKFDWGIDSGTGIVYLLMFVVAPLLALTITFYNQRNERIDCSKLSSDSIRYLKQGGEEIPFNCGLDR